MTARGSAGVSGRLVLDSAVVAGTITVADGLIAAIEEQPDMAGEPAKG